MDPAIAALSACGTLLIRIRPNLRRCSMRKRTSGGFTVTELKTVLVIICVLISIITLGINEYLNRVKLRTTAEMVASDIRRARWLAKCTSSTCSIDFDVVSNSYMVNDKDHAKIPDGIRFGISSQVTGRPGNPYAAPPSDGITFSNNNRATFYSTGIVVPTGGVYLTDGRETMAITVAITGRPKIWRSLGGTRWAVL